MYILLLNWSYSESCLHVGSTKLHKFNSTEVTGETITHQSLSMNHSTARNGQPWFCFANQAKPTHFDMVSNVPPGQLRSFSFSCYIWVLHYFAWKQSWSFYWPHRVSRLKSLLTLRATPEWDVSCGHAMQSEVTFFMWYSEPTCTARRWCSSVCLQPS